MQAKSCYSRSEAFRDAVRGLIAESELARVQTEKVAATIRVTCGLCGMHGIQQVKSMFMLL